MTRNHTQNTIKKMKLSQQARRLREQESQRIVPVYESNKIIGHINMGSNVDSFVTLFKKSQAKHRKPKVTSSGKGCLFLTLLYFAGLPIYLWATQSATEVTGTVEAKTEPIVVQRVLEVKKVEPVLDSSRDSSREELEKYICSKGWDCAIAIAVLTAENRNWDCQAINTHNFDGSVDKGLFQVNSIHNKTDEELFNCYTNIDIAHSIYQSQGWNAWTSYWRGNYLKYLGE